MTEFKAGDLVEIKETGELAIVSSYDDDTCGDGCCEGVLVHGRDNYYWPSDLKLIVKGYFI